MTPDVPIQRFRQSKTLDRPTLSTACETTFHGPCLGIPFVCLIILLFVLSSARPLRSLFHVDVITSFREFAHIQIQIPEDVGGNIRLVLASELMNARA